MSEKFKNKEANLDEILENTFNSLKDIASANVVVGKALDIGNLHIYPVSKVSVGILTGGGDKIKKKGICVGCGSGFNIVPIGFVTIKDEIFDFLPVNNDIGTSKILDSLFKIYEGIKNKAEEDKGEED